MSATILRALSRVQTDQSQPLVKLPDSATFRNETWNPSLYHRVEPASDLNPVDLLHGSFRNLRDVVVLANSLQRFRGGKDRRSTLDRPGEQDLGWGVGGLPGDGQNRRIFQWAGSYSMTQGRK